MQDRGSGRQLARPGVGPAHALDHRLRLVPQLRQVQAGNAVVLDHHPAVHQQSTQAGAAATGHRADGRIVQAEEARVVEVVDREVGRHADRQGADTLEPHHRGATGATDADDVLDRHRRRVAAFAGGVAARPGARVGAVQQPGGMGFAEHVGGFVRCRAVDRQADPRAGGQQLWHTRDAAAQPGVALRAMRDAGAGLRAERDLVVVQVHHVRVPDIGADPLVLGDELHRRAAMHLPRPLHVVEGLRQVAVQVDAQAARLPGQRLQVLGRAAPVGRGDRTDHAPHRPRAGLVEALHVLLDGGHEGVQRLRCGLRRRCHVGRLARHRLAATAQHETLAEPLGLVEDHGRGVEGHAGVVVVLVVGHRGAARQQQFDQAHARRHAQRMFVVEVAAVGHRHRRQPGQQREVDARRNALEQALEQVVVGVDPARVDHAAGRVDHAFAGLGDQAADGLDDAAAHAQVGATRGAYRGARQAGHQVRGATHQQGVSHASLRFRASRPGPSGRAPPSRRKGPRRPA